MQKKTYILVTAICCIGLLSLLFWHCVLNTTGLPKRSARHIAKATNQSTTSISKLVTKPKALETNAVQAIASEQMRARALFFDESADRLARFRNLSELARRGNADAKYFEAQMAMDCEVAARAAADPSILSNSKPGVRDQVAQAISIMNTDCSNLLASPEYEEFKQTNDDKPRDAFNADIVTKMKEEFANNGPDSLRSEALGALMSRPDETTVSTIVDTYQDIGVADAFAPSLQGLNALPANRNRLLTYALNLLTCYYGRPCGPNSAAVAMVCSSLGACEADADLGQIYADKLLSGEDLETVTQLLNYFEHVPVNPNP